MKKISDYRALLGVGEKVELKELKTIYRDFMKQWHPDKFQDEQEMAAAQEKSKEIIAAYHFLVSISPETHAQNAAEYLSVIGSGVIADIAYKNAVLKIIYAEGSCYEYFGVPKALYIKLVNADTPARFARRHICGSFTYRFVSSVEATV